MAEEFTYQKKRKDFGRHAQFEDTETKIVGSVPPNLQQREQYLLRDPNRLILDNIPQYSEHRVSIFQSFCHTFHNLPLLPQHLILNPLL